MDEGVCTTQFTYSVTNTVHQAIEDNVMIQTYIGHQDYYQCILCNRSMSGIVPAQSHLEGSQHRKAIRNYMYSSVLSASKGSNLVSDSVGNLDDSLPPDYQSPAPVQSLTALSQFETDLLEEAMKRGIVTLEMTDGQSSLFCKLCNISCTGEASMNQHLEGEPHCKKQRRMGLEGKVSSLSKPDEMTALSQRSLSPTLQSSADTGDILKSAVEDGIVKYIGGISTPYTCTVCNTFLNGETPMKQHLLGNSHQKKIRISQQMGLNTASSSCSTPPSLKSTYSAIGAESPSTFDNANPSTGLVESALIDGTVRRSLEGNTCVFTCTYCNIPCTGETPIKQHLQSSNHQKKMRLNQQRGLNTPSVPSCTPSSLQSMVFDDATPSSTMLQSALKDGIVMSSVEGNVCVLTCTCCNVPCSGETPMKQHLQSSSHQKKMRGRMCSVSPVTSSGTTSPPVAVITSTNVDAVCEKIDCTSLVQSSEMPNDFLKSALENKIVKKTLEGYNCLICSASCNGIITISDHLTGDQHHKKLRDLKNFEQFKKKDESESNHSSPLFCGTSERRSASPVTSRSNNENISENRNGSAFKKIDGLKTTENQMPETLKDMKVYTPADSLGNLFDE
ncbi:hypothetical protein OTU49_001123 [Cherax quadricarinatus]|uniref:C2H2-type domain-containing protein n=1 Tax=Cherax quadricarinatus TaxID=27406 RepID=A0AAW0XGE8_CHEQU